MKIGKVYLIGAGPGDPGLITLKGLECLKKSDVVVYDHLANEELLAEVPAESERIYVGKKGGEHTLSQGTINALLIEKAQAGKVVSRLKGGDPFIFGRGGEEAEALFEAGIPFEVVPGVSSAVAAPAYAGIPLTHRDYTSTVALITGHEDPHRETSRIFWDKISTGAGTLVFLMGVGNLSAIASSLIRHGRSPQTPVAVIRWGTLPTQETLTGTLADIAALAQAHQLKPPAIIVVGEVVALREKLNWFERLPLFGKQIVVTRAAEQAGELSQRLRALGAHPIEFPTIEVIPPAEWRALDHCLQRLGEYDWIVFTSRNAVRFFVERLVGLGFDLRHLKGPRICAIGPRTAEGLEALMIRVDYVPREYRAEAIVEGLTKENLQGKRILIPRSLMARDLLPDALKKAGAIVDVVEAYRTVIPQKNPEELRDRLRAGTIDAITFTSSSTVENFVECIGSREIQALLRGIVVASIGPITAETARGLGIETTVMPQEYTIAALVEALVEHFRGKP
jgi:uroporphyrinogen III methyltransferase/synthase